MKKSFIRLISSALICTIILAAYPFQASAKENDADTPSIDTSNFEVKAKTNAGVIYEPDCASPYVPDNATINEIYKSSISNIIYVDYVLDGIRHIDDYLPDGTVRNNSVHDGILTTVYENVTTETSLDFEEYHQSLDEDTLAKIKDSVSNGKSLEDIDGIDVYKEDGKTFITPSDTEIESSSASGSSSNVQGSALNADYKKVIYNVEDFFPTYNAKRVASASEYISELGTTRSTYAYETQDYYTNVDSDRTKCAIGLTAEIISTFISWPTSAIEAVLSAANVLSAAGKLIYNIYFYTSCETQYWFAVEGGVYDTTKEHATVHVDEEEGWGTFTYGLNSDDEAEWYRTINDIPDSYSYHFANDYSSFLANTAKTYNNVLGLYGYWPWGVGTFGG